MSRLPSRFGDINLNPTRTNAADVPKKQKIELGRYIMADPEICRGKPTFSGTRIMVSVDLASACKK